MNRWSPHQPGEQQRHVLPGKLTRPPLPCQSMPFGYHGGMPYHPPLYWMQGGWGRYGWGAWPPQRRTAQRKQTPPIAPVKPCPPDPYINQFTLAEALQKGTLFPWLSEPEEDATGGRAEEVNDEKSEAQDK
ncbi:hypothetical protein ACFSO0_14800 [Brevibacillus sp. GCM10020057]|uniref:hypothetical protein n=1 Tax=Brevibacillus sp. GCM10020057 TaxID=3317327 RepID=UPI00362816C3